MSYLVEMHYHTPETSVCCKASPKEIFSTYAIRGYSAIVVTDHYYKEWFDHLNPMSWQQKMDRWLSGYHNARDGSFAYDITVILGMELRFKENSNDYLVYGLDEAFLYQYPELYQMTPKTFLDFANAHGLFFAQAHPFRPICTPADPRFLHGVEVYNGNPRQRNHNELAESFAADNHLIPLSGSDFHQVEDACLGGLYFSRKPSDSHDVAEMLHGSCIDQVKTTV